MQKGGKDKKGGSGVKWQKHPQRIRSLALILIHIVGYSILLTVLIAEANSVRYGWEPFRLKALFIEFEDDEYYRSYRSLKEQEMRTAKCKPKKIREALKKINYCDEEEQIEIIVALEALHDIPLDQSLPILEDMSKQLHTSRSYRVVTRTLDSLRAKTGEMMMAPNALCEDFAQEAITALLKETKTSIEPLLLAFLLLKVRRQVLLPLIYVEDKRLLSFLIPKQQVSDLFENGSYLSYKLYWLANRHKYPKQILPKGWDENKILLEFVEELRKDKNIATKYKNLLDRTEQEAKKALEEQKDAPQKPSK